MEELKEIRKDLMDATHKLEFRRISNSAAVEKLRNIEAKLNKLISRENNS